MTHEITDKNILITGGAGSVGQALVTEVLKHKPKVIRILDNSEESLFNLEHSLPKNSSLRFLVGDLRDKDRVRRAVEGIDLIIHAAALKHVSLCEYNPSEAIKTNILGTQNLIEAAIEADVGKVMLTSSDKAANPTNVMGATKLLSEKLMVAANNYRGTSRTIFSSVRFGNVIGSSGSVIPLFFNQLRRGGPMTITDPAMSRFILSLDEAVHLVMESIELMHGGEVFILKMPVVGIEELARTMSEQFADTFGYDAKDVKLEIIGTKPGEKLYEEMMTTEEASRALETDKFFIILPPMKELMGVNRFKYSHARKARDCELSSNNWERISPAHLKKILQAEYLKINK